MKCSKIGEPQVVRIPFVGWRSLWAIGSPCRGPTASPRASFSSASRASAIARSATSVTIALTRGLTAAMRSRCAAITSRAVSSFARINRASSTALNAQMSVLIVSLGQLDVDAGWIGDVRDLETDGRHFPIGDVELHAARFQPLAERLEILH